jgi:hypothetical protein
MRSIGDIVLFEDKKAVVTDIVRPKCMCKGQGFYMLHLVEENYRKKVPVSTILETWKDSFKIEQKLITHQF